MTYQQATQAFNDLVLKCERLAAANGEETPQAAEEASQLVTWLIAQVCNGIPDEQLLQILRLFRFKNLLPPEHQRNSFIIRRLPEGE